MVWLPDGENIENMFTRIDSIYECGLTPYDGIGRAYAWQRAAKMTKDTAVVTMEDE